MRTNRLPPVVKPNAEAGIFDAANKHDMQRLATILKSMQGDQASMLAAGLVEKRVMFPPLLHRVPAWIAVKRGQEELMFWCRVFRHPKIGLNLAREILSDAARWATNGQDTEGSNSAGGFSQREVNFIANLIAVIRGDITARQAA